MAEVTIVKALTGYFNVTPNKLPASGWVAELRKLSDTEKLELAQGVCEITGDTLKV